MKTGIVKKKFASALLGFILALSGAISASAQGVDYIASNKKLEIISKVEVGLSIWNDEEKEEFHLEDISIDIEEVATVTFINKWGEVVAVLKGDKSVLDDMYKDRIAKSYFLSAYGIHEVYLIK